MRKTTENRLILLALAAMALAAALLATRAEANGSSPPAPPPPPELFCEPEFEWYCCRRGGVEECRGDEKHVHLCSSRPDGSEAVRSPRTFRHTPASIAREVRVRNLAEHLCQPEADG